MDLTNIKNNEHSCCAKCPDCCCEELGCELIPEDVIKHYGKIDVSVIDALVKTGVILIDVYDAEDDEDICGVTDIMFPRIRTVEDHHMVDHPYFGKCILLTDTGCKLSWDDRPTGAKIMVPNPDNPGMGCTCIIPNFKGKKEFAKMWIDYQTVFEEWYKMYVESLE